MLVLVVKDEHSGSSLAYDCEVEGTTDVWVMKQLVRDLDGWGRADVCMKTDGEPALLAVQKAMATMRPGARTLPRNPPAYIPQTDGSVEKAVQDVTGQARKLVLALAANLKSDLDLGLPIVKWLVRHAAFLLTRFATGHDGLTPWRRLTGKNFSGEVV